MKLIRKLANIRTPNPSSGFSASTNTATRQAPEAFKPHPVYYSKEDPLAKDLLEGGPKTYKVSEEIISSNRLIKELDINPELPPVKRQ